MRKQTQIHLLCLCSVVLSNMARLHMRRSSSWISPPTRITRQGACFSCFTSGHHLGKDIGTSFYQFFSVLFFFGSISLWHFPFGSKRVTQFHFWRGHSYLRHAATLASIKPSWSQKETKQVVSFCQACTPHLLLIFAQNIETHFFPCPYCGAHWNDNKTWSWILIQC